MEFISCSRMESGHMVATVLFVSARTDSRGYSHGELMNALHSEKEPLNFLERRWSIFSGS